MEVVQLNLFPIPIKEEIVQLKLFSEYENQVENNRERIENFKKFIQENKERKYQQLKVLIDKFIEDIFKINSKI